MPPVKPRNSTRSQTVADDSAIREMVKKGILKAREKLIDLTMRNSMLSFRHSETSARHVRIVHQKLDFLVATFATGGSLDLAPLPPTEAIPRDEDADEFRAALKTARQAPSPTVILSAGFSRA